MSFVYQHDEARHDLQHTTAIIPRHWTMRSLWLARRGDVKIIMDAGPDDARYFYQWLLNQQLERRPLRRRRAVQVHTYCQGNGKLLGLKRLSGCDSESWNPSRKWLRSKERSHALPLNIDNPTTSLPVSRQQPFYPAMLMPMQPCSPCWTLTSTIPLGSSKVPWLSAISRGIPLYMVPRTQTSYGLILCRREKLHRPALMGLFNKTCPLYRLLSSLSPPLLQPTNAAQNTLQFPEPLTHLDFGRPFFHRERNRSKPRAFSPIRSLLIYPVSKRDISLSPPPE